MRLLLLGDGRWAARTLELLVEDRHEVLAVVFRRASTDDSLRTAAERQRIRIRTPANINEPRCVEWVQSLAPDLSVSVSYDQIFRRPFLEASRLGAINAHAGKLPYYRGRSIVNWAIINGEREIGITVHTVDEGIDTGGVLVQRTLPIGRTHDYGDVLDNLVNRVANATLDAVRQLQSGRVLPRPQVESVGTYFSKRQAGDEWIDWSLPSERIYNLIRGVAPPGPGALTVLGNRSLRVLAANFDPEWPEYIATHGQVVGVHPGEGVLVKTGSSTLVLQRIRFEDEAEECVPSFKLGTRLGLDLLGEVLRLRSELAQIRRKIE